MGLNPDLLGHEANNMPMSSLKSCKCFKKVTWNGSPEFGKENAGIRYSRKNRNHPDDSSVNIS